MQKKSLLVALFCGALCLTGCIKNEESASVAQVRIAKANELNSIADLNKAKAAAEAVYAQAELILAEAEKTLKEAEANFLDAQAETERVRAELLKVRVQLQTVKVEEEKIELLKKEAELEVYLAQAEAAKAAAEAAQQYWINKLEDLLAQAEITALKNAKKYMEAENDILKLQGERADSAKVYAQLYFEALDTLAKYQVMEIEVKVAKVLVERKAPEVRDAIYGFIDDNNEKIAENNAKIEAYKKYQTVTPEEAEEKYQAASAAASEAYTAWIEASDAITDANTALSDLNNMTADFTHNWNWSFANAVKYNREISHNVTDWYLPVTFGEGENAETRLVKTTVFVTPSKTQEGEFDYIRLWNAEKNNDKAFERYPNVDVYGRGDFTILTTTLIAPATINYDNVKVALDTAIARKEAATNNSIAEAEKAMNTAIKGLNKTIANNKEKVALHQEYVKARKAKVKAAEDAYIAEVGKAEAYRTAKEDAWKIFQEYMVLNHDETRILFIDRNKADSVYTKAAADTVKPYEAWIGVVNGITGLVEKVEPAHVAVEEAIGEARQAQAEWTGAAGSTLTKKNKLIDAYSVWSPDFDEAEGEPQLEITAGGDTVWYKGTLTPVVDTVQARYYQRVALTAQRRYDDAEKAFYILDMDLKRNPEGTAHYETVKAKWDAADERLERLEGELGDAQEDEAEAADNYDDALTKAESAIDATLKPVKGTNNFTVVYEDCNPDFDARPYVEFPLPTSEDYLDPSKYIVTDVALDAKGKWVAAITKNAGTKQIELLNAVKAVADAYKNATASTTQGTAAYAYAQASSKANIAKTDLDNANIALIAAIKGVPTSEVDLKKDKIEDYMDTEAEKLYRDYKDIEDESKDLRKAYDTLWMAYSVNPDVIGKLMDMPWGDIWHPWDNIYTGSNAYRNAMFGWLRSSYETDYLATYVTSDGKRAPIAKLFYNDIVVDDDLFVPEDVEVKSGKIMDVTNSLQYLIEEGENQVNVVLPAEFAATKTTLENGLKTYKSDIAKLLANVNGYKAHETNYKTWVADREKAEVAVNEAIKAEFDAKEDLAEAKAEYEAARAALNGGVIYELWDDSRDGAYAFRKVSINDAIEKLETENENLEKENEKWYQTLKDGKVAYGLVNEILDEILEKVEEAIDIWAAIAEKYKAIMNGYLGIVEETVVEPVEEEGDEE